MASKDKSKDKSKSKGKKDTIKLNSEQKEALKDFQGAGAIFRNSGLDIPLSKLDNTVPADQQNLINQLQGELDPSGAGFIGGRSPELQAAIDKMYANLGVSPEERAQLDVLKKAQERTAETSDILERLKGGLSGFTAAENTSLRENSRRETDSAFQTALSQVRKAGAGKRNVFTNAALAKANQDFTKTRAIQENDLAIKNLQEQDVRRGQYADVLGSAESREAGRRGQYADFLGATEANSAGKLRDYTSLLSTSENDAKGRLLAAQGQLGSLLYNRDNTVNDINKFNADQFNKQAAANAAGITGIANYMYQKKYGNDMIDIARSGVGGGSHSGSSSGSSGSRSGSSSNANNGNTYSGPFKSQNAEDYYNTLQNLYKQYGMS